jgi:hypothetical protein
MSKEQQMKRGLKALIPDGFGLVYLSLRNGWLTGQGGQQVTPHDLDHGHLLRPGEDVTVKDSRGGKRYCQYLGDDRWINQRLDADAGVPRSGQPRPEAIPASEPDLKVSLESLMELRRELECLTQTAVTEAQLARVDILAARAREELARRTAAAVQTVAANNRAAAVADANWRAAAISLVLNYIEGDLDRECSI